MSAILAFPSGPTLKKIRKSKGITQAELVNAETPQQICSLDHLRMIEKGERIPSSEILLKILTRLDVSYDGLMEIVYGQKHQAFMNKFAMVWDGLRECTYDELAKHISELKCDTLYDKNIPAAEQVILLLEGILHTMHINDKQRGLEIYIHALSLTNSCVVKDNKLLFEKLDQCFYTLVEYRILSGIASCYDRLKDVNNALFVYSIIYNTLNHNNVEYAVKKKLLPAICRNYATALYKAEKNSESLMVSTRGIDFCNEVNELKEIGRLHSINALAAHYSNDRIQAHKSFMKLYNYHKTFSDDDDVNNTVKLASKFNYKLNND